MSDTDDSRSTHAVISVAENYNHLGPARIGGDRCAGAQGPVPPCPSELWVVLRSRHLSLLTVMAAGLGSLSCLPTEAPLQLGTWLFFQFIFKESFRPPVDTRVGTLLSVLVSATQAKEE